MIERRKQTVTEAAEAFEAAQVARAYLLDELLKVLRDLVGKGKNADLLRLGLLPLVVRALDADEAWLEAARAYKQACDAQP